jgi:hypothetical protein
MLVASRKDSGRYRAHRSIIHEPQPCLIELRHIEPVTGHGLRIGIVFSDRLLEEAHRLSCLGPATQGGQGQPAPPSPILETHSPLGIRGGHAHQSALGAYFLSYRGSAEVIHRLALCQRTPRRRARVARIGSPEIRLSTSPSSKLTGADISSAQRLLCPYQTPSETGAASPSRLRLLARRRRPGFAWGEEPEVRASRPLSLKLWMVFRICSRQPHPEVPDILGGDSPRELAGNIGLRRTTKASLKRSLAVRAWRSSTESERTKIGGFMETTLSRCPQPTLEVY